MAKIDYSLLIVDKIIIHDIPKHKKTESGGSPNYSENESTISDGLRAFFQDKIKAALISDQAFKVCFKEESTSSVHSCVTSIICNDATFVIKSQEIATNLYNFQKGNNAAGILLVLKGHISTFQICVILKLERDNGAQLVLNEDTRTFNVEEVKDLMLTKKTKIFKVALFVDRSNFTIEYDGILMDYQINIKNKKETNTFFLDFMGCKPFLDPKFTTKQFYDLTRNFIDPIPDVITRSKYTQDLNSYLQKNQTTISPNEFSNDYMIEIEHKNQYKEHLKKNGFAFATFTKDTTLIDSHINKILIEFENDISILGKKGTLQDKVTLTQNSKTGECTAEIKSKIKKIK